MNVSRITLVTIACAIALTACSSDTVTPAAVDTSSSLSTTPSEATPSTSQSQTTSVELGTTKIQGLGTVLTEEADGRTVYLFTNDTGSKSTCTRGCAGTWPALTSEGEPSVTGGADDSKVATTKGSDGSQQVTYDGHPLYLYSGDKDAGDANGQGIGGVWFAVTPDGNPAGQADDNGGGMG